MAHRREGRWEGRKKRGPGDGSVIWEIEDEVSRENVSQRFKGYKESNESKCEGQQGDGRGGRSTVPSRRHRLASTPCKRPHYHSQHLITTYIYIHIDNSNQGNKTRCGSRRRPPRGKCGVYTYPSYTLVPLYGSFAEKRTDVVYTGVLLSIRKAGKCVLVSVCRTPTNFLSSHLHSIYLSSPLHITGKYYMQDVSCWP